MGIERLPRAAYVQLVTRIFAAAMTFVIVRGRDDGWRVLLLFALGSAGGCLATNWMMYRAVPPVRLRLRRSLEVLRGAGTLFVGFTAGALYASANVVVLGLFVSSAEVAYFGAAEKIVRAVIQVLTPVSYVIYPRVSLLLTQGEPARARRLVHIAMAVLGGVALMAAGGLIALAPLLIRIVYGHAFHPAVTLLRVLALILIPLAISLILNGCWMLALKLDRKVLRVVTNGAAVNLLLAVVLVPLLGPLGMAIAVLTAEGSVLFSSLRSIRRNERNKGVPALLRASGGSLWGELRAVLLLAGAWARGRPGS
jgi:PST family polysaccharide transporter